MRHLLPLLTDLPTIGPGPHPAPGRLEVDIWRHHYSASSAPERLCALLARLSPDEQTRAASLRDDRRRQQFVVGRTLIRRVLSRYAPVPADQWRFALDSRGKPSIGSPALSAPLWFTLSHTDGVSVCAVTGAGPDLGIDVERGDRGNESLDIAQQFFPQREVAALRDLPAAQRGESFVRLWALKESLAKAGQLSLADGISGAVFDLSKPNRIDVTFCGPVHEKPQDWQFQLFGLDRAHVVALAARTPATEPLSVRAGTCLELS